jgi:hypothetical protein
MRQDAQMEERDSGGFARIVETLLLTLSVTGLWYYCYYLLAPWIWRQNMPFRPEDIAPWILSATNEHDGIEIYALYIMIFLNIVSALSLSGLIGCLAGRQSRRIILALSALFSIAYCAKVGFIPPMNSQSDYPLSTTVWESLLIMIVTFLLTGLLYYLYRRSSRWGLAMASLLLAPVCFIATSEISWADYSYIFAPALRLLNGAAISDIYFQYDLLPSLLAAAWMKLGLDLNDFRILGQAGYYFAILGVFILSGKLFQKKSLCVLLLTALVLGRIYASPYDATIVLQVTPLRLDLWLPLLLVVYRWGPYHWSAGLVCGLLIILLKNFGIIYSAAYIQLLLTLWGVGYWDEKNRGSLLRSLVEHGKRCAVPAVILACCSITSYFLFRNAEFGNYAGYYQKIGIGFIQIARNSFYWYVPAIFSTVLILLLRLRAMVSSTYLNTGLLLTFCAIGNSIYFFGRSHEHNILNIAIVLLFLFFFMLDLVSRSMDVANGSDTPPSLVKKFGANCVAVAVIAVIIVSYSENILFRKGLEQLINARKGKLNYPTQYSEEVKNDIPENLQDYINKLRTATGNSPKVYFIKDADFIFYYYGGYAPVGYCNPFHTWIFNKDLKRFLQGLLDNGYYLVCSPKLKYVLANLQYNSDTVVDDTVVVSKSIRLVPKP